MKWLTIGILVVIVGFCLFPLIEQGCSRWRSYRTLPSGRDPRLIGVWKFEREGSVVLYQFRPDGTGIRAVDKLSQISMRLKWGTAGGQLTLSWPSIDSGPRYGEAQYRISEDGTNLAIMPSETLFHGEQIGVKVQEK